MAALGRSWSGTTRMAIGGSCYIRFAETLNVRLAPGDCSVFSVPSVISVLSLWVLDLRLPWIRTSRKNCERAIQLFSQHNARQLVRVGHRTQRHLQAHAFAQCIGKSIGITTHEYHFFCPRVALR